MSRVQNRVLESTKAYLNMGEVTSLHVQPASVRMPRFSDRAGAGATIHLWMDVDYIRKSKSAKEDNVTVDLQWVQSIAFRQHYIRSFLLLARHPEALACAGCNNLVRA